MAKAKEQLINVPLRREFLKVPRTRRAKKAVNTLRNFIAKKTRVDVEFVKIGPKANEKIWERGIQKPPHHILVKVVKETIDEKTYVFVEIPEAFDDFINKFKSKEGEAEKEAETEKESKKEEKSKDLNEVSDSKSEKLGKPQEENKEKKEEENKENKNSKHNQESESKSEK